MWALPGEKDVSSDVYLEQPDEGGHIGFPRGNPPGDLTYLPEHILRFFAGFTPRARGLTMSAEKDETGKVSAVWKTMQRLSGKWLGRN